MSEGLLRTRSQVYWVHFFSCSLVRFLFSSACLTTVQGVPEDLKLLQDLVTDSKRALGPNSELPQLKGCTISKVLDIALKPGDWGSSETRVPGRFPLQKRFKYSLLPSFSYYFIMPPFFFFQDVCTSICPVDGCLSVSLSPSLSLALVAGQSPLLLCTRRWQSQSQRTSKSRLQTVWRMCCLPSLSPP